MSIPFLFPRNLSVRKRREKLGGMEKFSLCSKKKLLLKTQLPKKESKIIQENSEELCNMWNKNSSLAEEI